MGFDVVFFSFTSIDGQLVLSDGGFGQGVISVLEGRLHLDLDLFSTFDRDQGHRHPTDA
jgi:hypothetical protein